MSQTIKKHIGEGHGRGELYAALAYDENDVFGGMKIKGIYIDKTVTATGWCNPIVSKLTISTGNTGVKLQPILGTVTISAAAGSSYTIGAEWKHTTTDTVTGAAACINADLYISGGNFETTQTLQNAIFSLRSDQARTVTCTSENFNMVLIKNLSTLAGLNSLLKLVNAGGDNPACMIHVEGATDNGFIQFDSGSDCVADTSGISTGGTSLPTTYKIKCRFNSDTFYLIGVADF